MRSPASIFRWLFESGQGPSGRLIPRWILLRALGCIYFSAFFSLVFQIRGLIGPEGILPANEYLQAVAHSFGRVEGLWFAPSVLWVSSGPHMLSALCWIGMVASILLVLNVWPRFMLTICFVCFLSFVSAAQDFSGYQSDGMLLEAGFIALFFAPRGIRPRFGRTSPPRAALFLLQWEWFRIYFESGVAKIAGGDPEWRHFTAMDEYYQNGPLPTSIGWYVQHLPHWFHAGSAFATLALELVLVWMLFLPRRWRIVCFLIVTPWEVGVILTANYTFLNYLVLSLGVLLLDDRFLLHFLPQRCKQSFVLGTPTEGIQNQEQILTGLPQHFKWARPALSATLLSWIFYASTAQLVWMFSELPIPTAPVSALEPFRIANRYGLFGIMTRGRYEIEFQGSNDGKTWIAYPFRYKPQDPSEAPGIYAPYQPRFDWNLWFASLGSWQEYSIVPRTEVRLLANDKDVISLFRSNPFPNKPPHELRAVLWRYWFTSMDEKRTQGLWWRRQYIGLYAPTLEREADGTVRGIEYPTVGPRE
jgi:hypothetical protein